MAEGVPRIIVVPNVGATAGATATAIARINAEFNSRLIQDQARDAFCQASVTPPPPQPDVTRAKRVAARCRAVEDIKTAMVYLDQRARSQTNAMAEFSATAVMAIEALQIRMKSLQESLQRLQDKKTESKASKLAADYKLLSSMTSTTVTVALTIAEQDIFANSAEWDTQSHVTKFIRHELSRTPEPSDKTTSSTSTTDAQKQSEFESQSIIDAEYDISQDRQFQKFLRRFGGNRKSRK
ncbi:hypothetical protein BGZ47_005847 [Haplosporangium gracile]|nr:hypothetical protein BGZ47_005847 [Haplosporangium gracile]